VQRGARERLEKDGFLGSAKPIKTALVGVLGRRTWKKWKAVAN
jgi:hypothetical protein